MSRRKVGILTFHHVHNYGGMLQALALARAVDSFGHDAVIIDYRLPKAVKTYRATGLRSGRVLSNAIKRFRFERYLRNNAKLTSRRYSNADELRANPPDIDTIIVGSDQVWNIESYRGYDPTFFLGWTEGMDLRRISYAASAGHLTDFGSHADEIALQLRRFDHLSVREEATRSLIAESCGRDAELVCDPVFLSPIRSTRRSRPITKDYMLAYQITGTPLMQALVKQAINLTGIDAVSITGSSDIPGTRYRRYSAGPEQWLSFIEHAHLVITNSFHGACYCIMMRKPFWVPVESKGNVRIKQILEICELSDRQLTHADQLTGTTEADSKIDWNAAHRKLDVFVQASQEFLRHALDS